MSLAKLEAAMERKGMSENVRARIRRLNPDYTEGMLVRGWHPARTSSKNWSRDEVTKGQFIRQKGRAAFEKIPKSCIRKHGRRIYIPYVEYVRV